MNAANGQISWNPEADSAREIAIGEVARSIIVSALKALEAKKSLAYEYLPLYERFVEAKELVSVS